MKISASQKLAIVDLMDNYAALDLAGWAVLIYPVVRLARYSSAVSQADYINSQFWRKTPCVVLNVTD